MPELCTHDLDPYTAVEEVRPEGSPQRVRRDLADVLARMVDGDRPTVLVDSVQSHPGAGGHALHAAPRIGGRETGSGCARNQVAVLARKAATVLEGHPPFKRIRELREHDNRTD